MADILIRGGMKLPTCCEACYLFFEKRVGFASLEYITNCKLGAKLPTPWPLRFEKRADNCPLVELPEHGDLISREEALSMPFANGKYDHENADEHFIYGCETYKEWLEQLPVVILSNKEMNNQ